SRRDAYGCAGRCSFTHDLSPGDACRASLHTPGLSSQFDDVPAHRFSLWIVRVMIEKILQDERGLALLPAAQMDFGQEKLRMGEVRGIDLPRAFQVLHGRIELPKLEIRHAELRVGQR